MEKSPIAAIDAHLGEEKKYAIISAESIRTIAESNGCSDLSDEVAALISEDVSYRLREMTQASCQYMRHAKRRKMNTDDFNKALKFFDSEPIYGCGSSKPFRQARECEVFFIDDPELNLVNVMEEDIPVHDVGQTSVKAHWLAVEGIQKVSNITQAKVNGKSSKGVSEELLLYYDNMTKAILSNDKELMKIALEDLRTNSKILPLLSYFVNFVSNGVKKVSHDITQLTKLLHTIKSLMINPSLYLEPKPYLNMLVQGVLYCVIEPLAASINPLNDHWKLRDYAARLLSHLTREWSSPMNQLQYINIQALKDVFYDRAKPFCSHYGAVMGLASLGCDVVVKVMLPQLPSYWPHLSAAMDDTTLNNAQVKSDAHKVKGAILHAVDNILRTEIKEIEADLIFMEKWKKCNTSPKGSLFNCRRDSNKHIFINKDAAYYEKLYKLYNELYSYFGDSLAAKLPQLYRLKETITAKKDEPIIKLYDEESSKTGEELLTDLLKAEVEESCIESKSDISNVEDMDVDSRSFKSDRSYRSERSDEIAPFLDPLVDLTVKSTVDDPAGGIKLTISKRLKVKPVDEVSKQKRKRKQARGVRIQDVFECISSRRNYATFNFAIPHSDLRRMADPPKLPFVSFTSASAYQSLSLKAKLTGKRKTKNLKASKTRSYHLVPVIDVWL